MNSPSRVLVVNAGSSSLKLRLLGGNDAILARWDLPVPAGTVDRAGLARALADQDPPDAIGHRIVHGGRRYLGPVRIDAAVERELRLLVDLAPLHQPKSLDALDAVTEVYPRVPTVACFDTAFHSGMPAAASTYALPREWRERWDLRRYGFHGLSHAYATLRAGEMLDRPPETLRLVTCHLGAGASLAAVADGKSVDTTMGSWRRGREASTLGCCYGCRSTWGCRRRNWPQRSSIVPGCLDWRAPPTCRSCLPGLRLVTSRPALRWLCTFIGCGLASPP